MELHYKQEVTVGVLVMVALAVLFGGITWLSGKSFGKTGDVNVPVLFHDVSGIAIGNAVTVSGVKVGRVNAVHLLGADSVIVDLQVGRDWRPHADASVEVRALDFFGGSYIAYTPGVSTVMLPDGTPVSGKRATGLMNAAGGLAGEASEALKSASALLSEQTAEDVHNTMLAAQRALNVIAKAGSGKAVAQAESTMTALTSLSIHLDSVIANPNLRTAVNKLGDVTTHMDTMVVSLNEATKSLNAIMQKMDSNKGTLGRMVNDTTLYVEMTKLSKSLRLLLDDIRERPARYFNLKVF